MSTMEICNVANVANVFGRTAGLDSVQKKKIKITCFGGRVLKGRSRIGEIDDGEWYISGTGSTASAGSDGGISSVDRLGLD